MTLRVMLFCDQFVLHGAMLVIGVVMTLRVMLF